MDRKTGLEEEDAKNVTLTMHSHPQRKYNSGTNVTSRSILMMIVLVWMMKTEMFSIWGHTEAFCAVAVAEGFVSSAAKLCTVLT